MESVWLFSCGRWVVGEHGSRRERGEQAGGCRMPWWEKGNALQGSWGFEEIQGQVQLISKCWWLYLQEPFRICSLLSTSAAPSLA